MRPTDLSIAVAAYAVAGHSREGWVMSDEVRGCLKRFGIEVSTQQISASMARMAQVSMPWFERRECPWGGPWQYRITTYARTAIRNQLPGLGVHAPWLPVYRGES